MKDDLPEPSDIHSLMKKKIIAIVFFGQKSFFELNVFGH
jgi:hypothetical protein